MSHNPTAIIINNKSTPTVTATGGTLVNPPQFQITYGYESIVYDNTIVKFNNYIGNISFIPYNPDVTALTFNNFEAIGNLTIPYYITGNNTGSTITLNFPDLVYVNTLAWNTLLGNRVLDFPALKYLGNATFDPTTTFSGNIGITSISFPELLYANSLRFLSGRGNPTSLTSVSFPKLKKIYGGAINLSGSSITSLTFPALTNSGDIYIGFNSLLTSLSFPVLVSAANIVIGGNSVPSLTFPLLRYCTSFNITAAVSSTLTSISFPELITIDLGLNSGGSSTTFSLSGSAPNLTTVSFPNLLSLGTYGTFNASGVALTQASIDSILVKLASLNGTGGTTTFSGRLVQLSGGTNSTPSATGLAAKATLVARGCTVTNN